jgi:hypothetical protein
LGTIKKQEIHPDMERKDNVHQRRKSLKKGGRTIIGLWNTGNPVKVPGKGHGCSAG